MAGRACIIVEHDLDFVVTIADRAVVLQHGRLMEEDTIAALMSTDSVLRWLAATTPYAVDAQTT